MKYHEAICNGSGGGWDECDWTATDRADHYGMESYPQFEAAIEAHIAPTRILTADGRGWPHRVYVIAVYE